MSRLTPIVCALLLGSPSHAADCATLLTEYERYDSDRVRFEILGIQDNSASREQNRLTAVMILLQRQGMVLDLILAQGCDLPDPPREFSTPGVMCQGSPQACR